MIVDFLVFLAIGRVAIYFLQKFPFSKLGFIGKLFREGEFFGELFRCDICLGFWVYTLLSAVTGIVIADIMVVISQVITGMVASLIVHLIRVGWQTEFAIIEVN